MKTISKRLSKLEKRFGLGPGKEPILIVMSRADRRLALNEDRCLEILRERRFLPAYSLGLVNLDSIPDGLSAEETERFLREKGAEICGSHAANKL